MADMIATGLAWLNEQLTAKCSVEWTYKTAAGDSCTINVTEERQKLRVTDRQGHTKIERPDLAGTFDASELDFDDGEGVREPVQGATLERTFGSDVQVFRLSPPNNGSEPCWHYTDPQRVRIRVYAKSIGRGVA